MIAVDLGAVTGLAAIPFAAWAAYQAGVRQDAKRWLRERRADLYVDLLVEGHAEKEWALTEVTQKELLTIGDDPEQSLRDAQEWREKTDRLLPDLRLPQIERARLGARMAAYATPDVVAKFNAIGRPVGPPLPYRRPLTSYDIETAFAAFESQVRRELGSLPRAEGGLART